MDASESRAAAARPPWAHRHDTGLSAYPRGGSRVPTTQPRDDVAERHHICSSVQLGRRRRYAAKKQFSADQTVGSLRQIDVLMGEGKSPQKSELSRCSKSMETADGW